MQKRYVEDMNGFSRMSDCSYLVNLAQTHGIVMSHIQAYYVWSDTENYCSWVPLNELSDDIIWARLVDRMAEKGYLIEA